MQKGFLHVSSGGLQGQFNSSPSREAVDAFVESAIAGDIAAVTEFLDKYPGTINNKNKDGWPALIPVAWKGSTYMVELLLKRGADANQRDHSGCTALMHSARKEYREIVELLLEGGASLDVQDNSGSTVLTGHAHQGSEVLAMLEQWPEKQRQRLAEQAAEHARWLKATDCSLGTQRPILVPRPFNFSGAK